MERKCVVCSNINPHPRSQFCCEKCKQKYYYEKNKDKRTEYKKEHYQQNKETYIERDKIRVQNNKEQRKEYMKNYMVQYRKNKKSKLEEENSNEQ